MKRTNRRIVTIVVALLAGSLLVAGQAWAGDGRGNEPADLPASCFAAGIDAMISDFEAGVELWEGCLTDDYSFEFIFFPGGPSIVCPGAECPIVGASSRAELRALFAANNFGAAGYTATQHQMLNVAVDRSRSTATVTASIQANHFLPDNSVDIFWGDYVIDAVKEDGRWKVRHEVIVGTSFLKFQGTSIGGG